MTSLMPETIEPVTGTLPLPKAKRPRKSWTQAEVVALVLRYQETGRVTGEEHVKLISLGIVAKPSRETLEGQTASEIRLALDDLIPPEDPQRTLAIRYAFKHLQSLKASK
jgi:hypothetical protein